MFWKKKRHAVLLLFKPNSHNWYIWSYHINLAPHRITFSKLSCTIKPFGLSKDVKKNAFDYVDNQNLLYTYPSGREEEKVIAFSHKLLFFLCFFPLFFFLFES